MRFLFMFAVLAVSAPASAVDVPEPVRQAILKIGKDFEPLFANNPSEALHTAYSSFAAANHLMGGERFPVNTLTVSPEHNPTALAAFADLTSLSLEQRAVVYVLLLVEMRKIDRSLDQLNLTRPPIDTLASMQETAKAVRSALEKEKDSRNQELKRTWTNSERVEAPLEDAPIAVQRVHAVETPKKTSEKERAVARKELSELLNLHQELQSLAHDYGEGPDHEAHSAPVETVGQKNARIMGVINAVNAINSGTPLTSDQLHTANNLNALARGPLPSSGESGLASWNSGEGDEASRSFDEQLNEALQTDDPVKALALLKAEIARLSARLEARKEDLNTSDLKVLERAQRAIQPSKTFSFSAWQPRMPKLLVHLENFGQGLNNLLEFVPEIKLPKIRLPEIRLPKIELPRWPERQHEPEPYTYTPSRYYGYGYDSHPSPRDGSDGEGCYRAFVALATVGAVGFGGLVTTAVVATVYSDRAYIESRSMDPAAQADAIAKIIEGKGTWGTPDPWIQLEGVKALSDSYRLSGHRKIHLLQRVTDAVRSGQWKVNGNEEAATKTYLELVQRTYRDDPKNFDRFRVMAREVVEDPNAPLAFRSAVIDYPEEVRGLREKFSEYRTTREHWQKRLQEVNIAIAGYKETLKTPEKIRNIADVKKWLGDAENEYLPEAKKALHGMKDPFEELPFSLRYHIEKVAVENIEQNTANGIYFAYEKMGPVAGVDLVLKLMRNNPALVEKVQNDRDLDRWFNVQLELNRVD